MIKNAFFSIDSHGQIETSLRTIVQRSSEPGLMEAHQRSEVITALARRTVQLRYHTINWTPLAKQDNPLLEILVIVSQQQLCHLHIYPIGISNFKMEKMRICMLAFFSDLL